MFTESKIIKQITVLPASNAIQVQWANVVKKNDVVISETYERSSYTEERKDDFLAEVEGAAAYVAAVGW